MSSIPLIKTQEELDRFIAENEGLDIEKLVPLPHPYEEWEDKPIPALSESQRERIEPGPDGVSGCQIPVPESVSVVGFDNEPVQAFAARLTSYDFNAAGFIHRMLDFIARPPMPRGPYRHVPIEVEGIVMQRGTTAEASV